MNRFLVHLHGLAAGGDAVGRGPDGRTVFVPFGAPGEEAEVEVVEPARNFVRARLLELRRVSDQRVAAPCPVFTKCGGCQLQHLNAAAQLDAKRQIVIDALTRIGKLTEVAVPEVIPTPDPWHYRNSAQFVFGMHEGRPVAGFHATRSHEVVAIDECPLQSQLSNRALAAVRGLVAAGALTAFDQNGRCAGLRRLETRTSNDDRQVVITLVTGTHPFDRARVVERLRQELPELTGILHRSVRAQNRQRGAALTRLLWGEPYLWELVGSRRLRFHAAAFSQVNRQLAPTLLRLVREFASLSGSESVADLYAGGGFFTIAALADAAREVVAVERSPVAYADARWNLKHNRLAHGRVEVGAVEAVVKRWAQQQRQFEVVVLDPPRAGATQAIDGIVGMQPQRIVYVSCDPATLARDLAALYTHGYRTETVQPLDLFPQTSHVECVARLIRRS